MNYNYLNTLILTKDKEIVYFQVFQMAYLRVKDLCERLNITDTNDIQK